jgi:tRNA-binding protein
MKDLLNLEIRVGRIVDAKPFIGARKPAYLLEIDFGPEIGIKKSSAQITAHYSLSQLLNKLVVAVLNLPPKQIADHISECLVTGFDDGSGMVVLCVPERDVPLGALMH